MDVARTIAAANLFFASAANTAKITNATNHQKPLSGLRQPGSCKMVDGEKRSGANSIIHPVLWIGTSCAVPK